MTAAETFKDQKKLRHAEFITPPNTLKQKVGSGGIDPAILKKAQEALDNNTIDFKPIAAELMAELDQAIKDFEAGQLQGEQAIEALLYPAMQLKAQGAMFKYPLITDLADILVSFLETVTLVDKGVIEITTAHKISVSAVISREIRESVSIQGKALKDSLNDACERYYKSRKS